VGPARLPRRPRSGGGSLDRGRPDATWLELEHASVAEVFHTDPDAETYSPAIGWEGPLHFLGEYLSGVLPDRPSIEWYDFDEAEERRPAEVRAPEWAKAAAHLKSDPRDEE